MDLLMAMCFKGCPDQHSETAGREGGSAARLENVLSTHLQDGILGLEKANFMHQCSIMEWAVIILPVSLDWAGS